MHATTLLLLVFVAAFSIADRQPPAYCGPNERLEMCDVCPQPSCEHPDIPNKPCQAHCLKKGCACAEGYYRDDRPRGSGKCVTKGVCDLL